VSTERPGRLSIEEWIWRVPLLLSDNTVGPVQEARVVLPRVRALPGVVVAEVVALGVRNVRAEGATPALVAEARRCGEVVAGSLRVVAERRARRHRRRAHPWAATAHHARPVPVGLSRVRLVLGIPVFVFADGRSVVLATV
jgi:hypothetical protein